MSPLSPREARSKAKSRPSTSRHDGREDASGSNDPMPQPQPVPRQADARHRANRATQVDVWVSRKYGRLYHEVDCGKLLQLSSEIVRMPRDQAIRLGMTPCKMCNTP